MSIPVVVAVKTIVSGSNHCHLIDLKHLASCKSLKISNEDNVLVINDRSFGIYCNLSLVCI
jgi:hypothetical protein